MSSVSISSRSRGVGALLGLAVGDALGTTLEFRKPGTFSPLTDMVGGGPFRLPPGYWTDDTSMALCLGTSLIERAGFDATDQMQRYTRWRHEGYLSSTGVCFDIGNTVAAALGRFASNGDPFAGSTDPNTAGNGSLMRLAPVPIHWWRDPAQAIHYAGESSRTTHGARTAVDACRYYAGLMVSAIAGASKAELLSELHAPSGFDWSTAPLCSEIDGIARGSFKLKEPPEIRGSGYVVASLEAALWAFDRSNDFRSGCLLAANLGEDADTTAAIYGQLAGAFYGEEGLPEDWLAKLHDRAAIHALAERLLGP
ncbi:MAG TPA: ADP-ribosylglycohydrolase family protein [Polyangiaceae bacterium]|nr:ADP-ribosylglycohydrolase family protein [Polyangiaceae bacterium]